jgi:DNA-binding response OmpR family regulator
MSSTNVIPPRGLGGVGAPAELMRPLSLDGVVVLAAPPEAPGASDLVQTVCMGDGWSLVVVGTTEAAAWAAAARKTSLIVITGGDPTFVLDTVAAVRRSTTSSIAVLTTLSSHDRKRALTAGADLVLPENLDGDELRLHLVALLRRAAATYPCTCRAPNTNFSSF